MEQPAIDISVGDAPVLRVWKGGLIEWSEDQMNGGPPLHTAKIDPALVARTIADIEAETSGSSGWLDETWTGPDARHTSLVIRSGDREIVNLASWHELFEANPRLIVTATGVQPLGARSRNSVFEGQPAEYRRFRSRWNKMRERLRQLIPISSR